MDFNQIDKKIMQLKNKNEAYHQMVSRFLKKYEQEFSLKYAHESTVIEGNTCSYDEARKILYGDISCRSGSNRQATRSV